MTLSPNDRQFLRTLCPDAIIGVADANLDHVLYDWFARDHNADNPVYTWNDNESSTL